MPQPIELTAEQAAESARRVADEEAYLLMIIEARNRNRGEEVPSPPDSLPPPLLPSSLGRQPPLHHPTLPNELPKKTRAVVAAMGLRRIQQTFSPGHRTTRNVQQGLTQFLVHSITLYPHSRVSGWLLRNLIQNFN